MNNDRMTSKDAAKYLGIKLSTLWEWRNRSIVELPYYKIGKRKFFYMKKDLDNYLEKCRVDFIEPEQ
jgi:excisionase family DNA binding protein